YYANIYSILLCQNTISNISLNRFSYSSITSLLVIPLRTDKCFVTHSIIIWYSGVSFPFSLHTRSRNISKVNFLFMSIYELTLAKAAILIGQITYPFPFNSLSVG